MNEMAENTRARIGDNKPPAEAAIVSRIDEIMAAANAWVTKLPKRLVPRAGVEMAVIADEDTANACRDFIDQVEKALKEADAERVRQKKPHDDAAEAVQAKFRPLVNRLELCKLLLKGGRDAGKRPVYGVLQTWLDAEADRVDRERKEAAEAARQAQEEAAAAQRRAEAGNGNVIENMAAAGEAQRRADEARKTSEAAAKAKPQAQGAYATRAISYRTYYSAIVADPVMALRHYRDRPEIRAAIQALADADARTLKEGFDVPGCELKSERRAA